MKKPEPEKCFLNFEKHWSEAFRICKLLCFLQQFPVFDTRMQGSVRLIPINRRSVLGKIEQESRQFVQFLWGLLQYFKKVLLSLKRF